MIRLHFYLDVVMVGDDIRDDVLGAQAAGLQVLNDNKTNTVCMHIKYFMKMYIIHTYLSYSRDV